MWVEWIYLLLVLGIANSAPVTDRIFYLPDKVGPINFKQYSGYLNVSSGNQLFYWLTQAENANDAPVMLWLNGGPGCSSMAGLMTEFGPYHVEDDKLVNNPYSWNKYAHIIFLDAPAGVGFSLLKGDNYTSSDSQAAKENHEALLAFFEKFPELKANDFYVGGESYGGTYVPMLGALLLKDELNFPQFKGILIGNGCVNEKLRANSQVDFNYIHGLISEKDYREGLQQCCGNSPICDWYHWSKLEDAPCNKVAQKLDESNFYSGLDPYLLDYVCYPDQGSSATVSDFKSLAFGFRRKLQSTSTKNCHHENEYVPYLNRKSVQKAIHVNTKFASCSREVEEHYVVEEEDMTPFVRALANAGKRILLFNGDMDSVCTHVHNRQFVHQLGLELVADRQAWKLRERVPGTAGSWTAYKGLDFVTVNGAGHFVASPYEKPREALQLFVNFIRARNYSDPITH